MPEDDDEESFAAFMKYLSKATGNKEWLDTLKGSISSGAAAVTQAPGDMATFLSKQLEKTEAARELTAAQLSAAMDLLTPEQRTQVRSAGSAGGSGPAPGGARPGETPPPSPSPPDPAPKSKRKWL